MTAERLSTQRRRRPTRSGVVLSHELIVRTAIRLVQEHGSEGLSVRRLGAALGCDPTALYRWFDGTDDLVRAVTDHLIGEYLADFAPGPDLRSTLRDLGLRIHSALLAQPRTTLLTASRVSGRTHEIRIIEACLGALRGAGFSPAEAARHYHAFIDMALGFAALDAAALTDSAGGDENAWGAVYAQLPASTHPHIAACAAPLSETMRHSAYPAALELLLDGITAALARL